MIVDAIMDILKGFFKTAMSFNSEIPWNVLHSWKRLHSITSDGRVGPSSPWFYIKDHIIKEIRTYLDIQEWGILESLALISLLI